MPEQAVNDTKLFFDISGLIAYARDVKRFSGIQRVVTRVLTEIMHSAEAERSFFVFVDPKNNTLTTIEFRELPLSFLQSPETINRVLGTHQESSSITALSKHKPNSFSYYTLRMRLDVAHWLGEKKIFHRHGSTRKQYRQQRFEKSHYTSDGKFNTKPKRPQLGHFDRVAKEGDKLVLLDSSWSSRHVSAFNKAKARGVTTYTLVYDLIPIVIPEVTTTGMPQTFTQWLLRSIEYTDVYMAISESAKSDLGRFLRDHDGQQSVEVLPLTQTGLNAPNREQAEFPKSFNLNSKRYQTLLEHFDIEAETRALVTTPYVLCVGTIEARKNGWRLALAWKNLIDQGNVDMPRLIFAGRRGWLCSPLWDLLSSTGNIYGYVSIIEGPSDSELDFLYRHCLFAAMPSIYEGWGLPVGEALSYGKTALVSNTSSLPEVGQDMVAYCNPLSVSDMAQTVLSLVRDESKRRELEQRIRARKLRDWPDVVADLFRIIN